MFGDPVECSAQTIVSEPICCDPFPSYVFDWFLGTTLRDQGALTIGTSQPMHNQCHHRCSHADIPVLLRVRQAMLLSLLPGTLLPPSPHDLVFPFDTLLPVTRFGLSAFFLPFPNILFLVHPSAECGLQEEATQNDRSMEDLEGRLMRALLRMEERERRLATGGHAGHAGHPLQRVETPDRVVIHRPSQCEACQSALGGVGGQIKARRHIHDLPAMRLVVTEQHVDVLTCPGCPHQNVGTVPSGVQALAVSVSQEPWLPMERIGEVVAELLSCRLSEGTVAQWRQDAARTRGPTMLVLTRWLLAHTRNHVDDTGGRVTGVLHWGHVHATQWVTRSHWHRQRGQKAMDASGVVPQDTGRAIPDRWGSDDHSGCGQSVCGAPLTRVRGDRRARSPTVGAPDA